MIRRNLALQAVDVNQETGDLEMFERQGKAA